MRGLWIALVPKGVQKPGKGVGGGRVRILGSSEVFNLLDTVFTNKIYEISRNDLRFFFHLGDETRVPPLLVYLLRRFRIQ